MRRSTLMFALVAIAVLIAAQPAFAAPPYPEDPPDFSHPDSALPSTPFFNPNEGTLDRSVLVIYLTFPDNPQRAGQDEAWAANRFFGSGFGTVADYFDQTSVGQFNISPAPEDMGTADNGIVMIDLEGLMTFDTFRGDRDADGDVDKRDDALRNGLALSLADVFIDFAPYDRNGDGAIDNKELVALVMWPTSTGSGAATRGVAGVIGDELDGKDVAFSMSFTGTGTNNITNAHEMSHQAMSILDLYGLGAGSFAIGGPTALTGEVWWHPNAFEKLHFGWITPTVVTEDGFQVVDQFHTTGEAFIMYDPNRPVNDDRGVQDDYFIIENRQQTAGTYERDASDSGLAVWRIDESVWPHPNDGVRPIELMLPDGTIRAPGCRDNDLDGLVDEDPPGGVNMIGGNVDLNGDGLINSIDSGRYQLMSIINGGFDIDGDGSITGADNGNIGGVAIINGLVDVDGDGDTDAADNGDPWGNVDNDGDNTTLNVNAIDDDRDGTVDEPTEGVDEDPVNRPGCSIGSSQDAWDPSDSATPGRTMARPWQDGTASNLALRAIGDSSSSTCAYFDVLGPGVLLDTYDLATSAAEEVNPDETFTVEFPVMNTDDAGTGSEAFEVTLGVPEGWSATTQTLSLAPKATTTASIDVTVPPDALAGFQPLVARGVSASDPSISGESCEEFGVEVITRPTAPDALEPNDADPTSVDFSAAPPGAAFDHDHLDERILATGLSGTRSTVEGWSTQIVDLSLNDADDIDRFRVTLPDPEASDAHAEIPECGSRDVHPTSGLTERITFTGVLTIEVISPYREGPPINAPGEALDLGTAAASGTDYSQSIICPRSRHDIEALDFSFGESGAGDRENFPDYELRVEYKVSVERDPVTSESWWFLEREARGIGGAGSLPCEGGFFPWCDADPTTFLEMAHPMVPDRIDTCEADGCPDYYGFHWAGQTGLNLRFMAPLSMSFQLLDQNRAVVAEAIPANQLNQPPQNLASGISASDSNAGLAQADGSPVLQVLSIASLKPGFYALSVTGPAGSFNLQFEPPPAPPDSDGDGLFDAFDHCPGEAEDVDGHLDADGCVDPDNDGDGVDDVLDNCPDTPNPEQVDRDQDGSGDACDPTLDVEIDIKPGSEDNPINTKANGVIPVAVLSTELIDATGFDVGLLSFGPGEAGIMHKRGHTEDVNGDGWMDLVLHFKAKDAGIEEGAAQSCARGTAPDGTPVVGCDDVKMLD